MADPITTQISREAPELEAYRLGLIKSARNLVSKGVKLPAQMQAELTAMQKAAAQQGAAGIGAYQPYLRQSGYTLGDAQRVAGGAAATASPYLNAATQAFTSGAESGNVVDTALNNYQNLYGAIPTDVAGSRTDLSGIRDVAGRVDQRARQGGQGYIDALKAAQAGNVAATGDATQLARDDITNLLRSYQGNLTPATNARMTAQELARAHSGTTQDLRSFAMGQPGSPGITDNISDASRFALDQSWGAIEGLAGSDARFDPSGNPQSNPFFNQYSRDVEAGIIRDLDERQAQERNQLSAQAAAQGAFGGSRHGIMESELAKNYDENRTDAISKLRFQAYQDALQRSQQAFEDQKKRQLAGASARGVIAAQGSQAGASGLSSAGKLGIESLGLQGDLAGKAADMNLSVDQLAEQMIGNRATAGIGALSGLATNRLAGLQHTGGVAQDVAKAGLGLEELSSRTGLGASTLAGDLGKSSANLGLQAQELRGNLVNQGATAGLQRQQNLNAAGLNLGRLGLGRGELGIQQAEGISNIAAKQSGLGDLTQRLGQQDTNLLHQLGSQQQQHQQNLLDNQYNNQINQTFEPYNRLSYLSDIYKGTPSSQQTISQTTSPKQTRLGSILGATQESVGNYAGAQRGGLF